MDVYDPAVDLSEVDNQVPDGLGSLPLTQTASMQTEQCNNGSRASPSSVVHILGTAEPKAVNNQAIQAGLSLLTCPYQCNENRKRSELRSEIIENVHNLLDVSVHGNAVALSDLVDDLVSSKKVVKYLQKCCQKARQSRWKVSFFTFQGLSRVQ